MNLTRYIDTSKLYIYIITTKNKHLIKTKSKFFFTMCKRYIHVYERLTYMNKQAMHQTEKQSAWTRRPRPHFCDKGPFELISTVVKQLARIALKNGLCQHKTLCNVFTQKIANFFTKPLSFNTDWVLTMGTNERFKIKSLDRVFDKFRASV